MHADWLEKTLVLGKIEGKRRRGQQRTRWLDGLSDTSLSKFWEMVKDREAWNATVHGVTKICTWLRDWTTTRLCVYRYVCMYISLNPSKAVIFSILFYFIFENADCASLKWFHDSLLGCSTWQFEKHWPNRKHTDFDVKNKTKKQTKSPWNQISPLSLTTIGTVFFFFCFFKKKPDFQFPHL